ncbi:hypothetical protein PP175_25665 (plasmid) [Aneurinibacillus sp. Ricciae_BoGa-3]|uniref:hypothetical protein n=1 Tax=Aneurinibacillus sp. Ricciae_BoGa-3 TaxID=3022697 RepID=UPI00234133B0|nr:hypothetical protein [Aneurinibacillus sp. Ricciae_BoGa-3]WCK57457.1 hypothetical protein PP175_25665 [Aneurinibacillus sp. Ricciae_BoGa-3]
MDDHILDGVREEVRNTVAKSLLEQDVDIQVIHKATGLDIELIRRLKSGGMNKHSLVPKAEPSLLSYEEFSEAIPGDGQWEFYSGVPFDSQGIGRDTLALCLIRSMGLRRLLHILPEESKQILKALLQEE